MSSLKHRPLTSAESHPKDPVFFHDLAAECFKRYGLSGEKDDLDKLILRLSEKSSLPLADSGSDCIQTPLDLALAHIYRFKEFGEPGDINPTIASGISPAYLTNSLQALTRAALDAYSRGKQLKVIDQAIECLREALSPGSHQVRVSFDLSNLLAVRFLVHHADENYEEAKVLLDPLTASPCSYRRQALALKAALGHARSIASPNAGKSDGAISRAACRSFLDGCSSFGKLLHPIITELLLPMCQTGQGFDPPQGASAQVAHSNVDPPLFLQLRSFGEVDESDVVQTVPSLTDVGKEIELLRNHFSSTSPLTDRQQDCLNKLVRCYRAKISLTHDITDIEDAIKWHRLLLKSTHPSDPSMSFHRSSFANLLYFAFSHIKRVEYLDESVTIHREVLGVENARLIRFATIRRLIETLSSRWRLFRHKSDLDEIMELFASGVEDTYVTVPSRFELACDWAYAARISVHHSLPRAYGRAMSIMQSSLAFAPTLPIQHERLVEKRDLYEKTPLNFASYQIRMGKLELAIETLEQGRALLWSEMHGLRTSTDQLRTADPDLAEKFTAINKEIEILTTSASSDRNVGTDDDGWMAQLSDLIVKQQELLKERDGLISEIRSLPGFENFLLPLRSDTLRSASSHGPVIIINHCKWRSDIIIVLHDSPPSLISTPYYFFGRVNGLKDKLLGVRQRCGPDSQQYVRTLVSVQRDLYELIGRPVIKRLNELGIPERSRVWWCPTSVLGYLPLHAMGPIPSAGNGKQYFSDIYISSYTPTLSTLITSRNSGTRHSNLPNILLVAQPDLSLPGVSGEIQVIQNLKTPVTSLISQNATASTVLDGLRHHQFCHFACHGVLTTGKPFDASLILYNEEPLMLLDIVRSRLLAGECAFLATCHTAELSDESMPDEVLHLSAAMQYSGFRSVIGTMWAMADEDGQYLAKYFYESMFSDERQGVPYYERSARALALAVRMLRGRGVSPERWVNYVHFGA
jgi:hypothetical protein